MPGIEGKVVAITGASSGIGRATASLLAKRGAKVILGARRDDRLKAIVEQIKNDGGEATHMAVDVTRRDDLTALVELARSSYGRLDVMVNNAGIAPISTIDELKVDDWEMMFDVNTKGLMYGVAAALPVFRQQGSGHFVNTLSTAGLKIVPTQVLYAASKNAARTFAEGLRQEMGASIRVTSVSPGFVNTDFADSMPDPEMRRQIIEARDKIAIPPEAIARAIAFAIEQPDDVDVNEIVIRPTAQG